MSTVNRTQELLTRAQAAERIRRAPTGTTFHVLFTGDASISEDRAYPNGASIALQVGRKKAANFALRMFSDTLEERGARVRVWTWDDAPEPKAIWFGN